jgi:hypothetical protein
MSRRLVRRTVMQKDASYPTLTPSEDLPAPRERADSHVRIRSGGAARTGFGPLLRPPPIRRGTQDEVSRAVLDELSEAQLGFTMSLLRAKDMILGIPRDPSAHAAAQSIRDRIADLHEVRSALAAVNLDACDARLAPLFAENGALTDYLRGLYTWTRALVRALEEIADGLRVLDPNWALLRARIEDFASFYLVELEKPIAHAATILRLRHPELDNPNDPLVDFDEHLSQLFWAAAYLAKNLENRFG